MILAIDVGNTQTHVGLFRGDKLERDWRLSTEPARTADEHALAMTRILEDAGLRPADLKGIVLASVVPVATEAVEEMARSKLKIEPLVVGPGLKMPIRICTADPARVGADRIANAVAASEWREPPVIVVDLGTATTFDVVADGARYLGGVICPGVLGSLEDLVRRTAKLPGVEIKKPTRVIGADTEASMQSGIVYGTAGQIDGIVRRIWSELGGECPVIATGGLAGSVAPFCETVQEVDRHLTLKGLRLIFEVNRPGRSRVREVRRKGRT